jgi:large repetitive protein
MDYISPIGTGAIMHAQFLTLALVLGCSDVEKRTAVEDCYDLADNDGDEEVDCLDADCQGTLACLDMAGDTDQDGYTLDQGDCNDEDGNIHPEADDTFGDDVDSDCDGVDGVDSDGDGYAGGEGGDTEDSDPAINPGAAEICNGIDDDSDGYIDEADDSLDAYTGSLYYADADGDGYGDADASLWACEMPIGYVSNSTDCDDSSGDLDEDGEPDGAEVFPGNLENEGDGCHLDADGDGWGDVDAIEGIDPGTDCDDGNPSVYPGNLVLEGDGTGCHLDADGDGWGDVNAAEGIAPGTDCDDSAGAVNPAATETCDGIDNDCDALMDDEDDSTDLETTGSVFYADTDGDGFGNPDEATQACALPTGHVSDSTDCDDGDISINTDADEICDEADTDEDCSGAAEDEATDASTWYADTDGDGFGDPASTTASCESPVDHVSDDTDCDDGNSAVYPGNLVNEGEGCHIDSDGDGWGDAFPEGAIEPGMDCSDAEAAISPDETEVCDEANTDEDCSGASEDDDPDATGKTTYYIDSDQDSYGDLANGFEYCDPPETGLTYPIVLDSTDCDDGNSAVYPGNLPNEGEGCHIDADGDGWGDDGPAAGIDPGHDCNDDAAGIRPDATEVCDEADIDEDCDELADDEDDSTDLSTGLTHYPDADEDGFGFIGLVEPDVATSCSIPEGRTQDSSDCDDTNAELTPSDEDGDETSSCEGDCNDGDSEINRDALEICDSIDNDCDTLVDDADVGVDAENTGTEYFMDSDQDGYGKNSKWLCALPSESTYVVASGDCNDEEAAVNPAAEEHPADGIDSNCDDLDLCYLDVDDDGIGGTGTALSGDLTCTETDQQTGFPLSSDSHDCDDSKSDVFPGASEVCDGYDNNCDGSIDFGDEELEGDTDFFPDGDSDGYGSPDELAVVACSDSVVDGYVTNSDDCNDADGDISPNGKEICDEIDNNCNGLTDNDDLSELEPVEYYQDFDHDFEGSPYSSIFSASCTPPANHSANNLDCNDYNNAINSAADEICDGIDNDCDDLTDEDDQADLVGNTYFLDADGDGDGSASETFTFCSDPAEGYSYSSGDCDDGNPEIHEAAVEDCSDELDNDCDELTDEADDDCVNTCYFENCDIKVDMPEEGIGADFILVTDLADPLGTYTLESHFYIMTTEVTQGMFNALMGYDSRQGCESLESLPCENAEIFGDGTDHPAYYATWHMAAHFANTLSVQEDLSSCYSCTLGSADELVEDGTDDTDIECQPIHGTEFAECDGYRLPNQNEWLQASRSGASGGWWTGAGDALGGLVSSEESCIGDEVLEDGTGAEPPISQYAWYCGSGVEASQEVAQLLPNGFGLYDMHGNVSEYIHDWPDGLALSYGSYWGGAAFNVETGRASAGGRRSEANGFRLVRSAFSE